MKVYNKIVFDIDGNVIEEDSFNHDGPVALCIPLVGAAIAAVGTAMGSAGVGGTIGGIATSTLLTLGGAAVGVGGSVAEIAQGQRTASANVKAAEIEQKQVMDVAKERSERRLRAGDREISSSIARLGASGVDILGSPLDVLMEDAANVKLASLDDLYAGRVSSSTKEYEAKIERFKAGTSLLNAGAGSAKTILGMGSSVGGMFINGRRVNTRTRSFSPESDAY